MTITLYATVNIIIGIQADKNLSCNYLFPEIQAPIFETISQNGKPIITMNDKVKLQIQ